MFVNPCCKINLGLHVVRKRNDGFHDLETVFYPIPLCDNLEVKPLDHSNAPYLFQQVGPQLPCPPAENLVIRVYESLKADFPLPQLDIYLHKKIPSGAGLGGGSSDAAFMMRALNEMFALGLTDDDMRQRVSALGADCAFFIRPQAAYATGRGDVLTPIDLSLKGWVLAVVKPRESVSTREAYAGIVPREPQTSLTDVVRLPVEQWRAHLHNDFEAHVFGLHPAIRAIKETLYDMGAVFALMSGSGSAVFALFRHKQDNLRKIFSDCFTFQATLLA